MEFADIEDIWKNENDERIEKKEITLKKRKEIKKEKLKEKMKNKCDSDKECCEDENEGGCCSTNIDKNSCCDNNTKNVKKCCNDKEKCSKDPENCCSNNKKNLNIIDNEVDINENKILNPSNTLPGLAKIYVKTYGCSHNTSDSEYMMGLLNEYGYKLTDDFESCDACVINSCTVKNPSQDAFVNYISKAKNNGKKVIVSGCVPQGDRTLPGLENCSVVGVTQIDRIVEVVEETLKGNTVKLLAKKELPSLDLPKIRRNKYVEIIPINTGCLGSCTYCKTKHARGKLGSYEVKAIVNACLKAAKEGVKEIWLTSEDTGAYGRDINTDITVLMMEILKVIPDEIMIRIGMTNPPYIMEHLNKMSKILNHPNVFSFLHIPVQAGSNSVLDKMNREYKIEDFILLCDYLKANVSNITIATDIICGFPSESKENFEETLNLIEKFKFPVINISQFYPRPGTVAAKWKKVDTKEVKRRSTEVTNLFKSYSNFDDIKDSILRVWVFDHADEGKPPGDDFMVGHTKSYVKVILPREENVIGKQVLVKITNIYKWHVEGKIVDYNPRKVKVNFYDHFKGMYNEEKLDYSNLKALFKNQSDIHELFKDVNLVQNNYSNNISNNSDTESENSKKSYQSIESENYIKNENIDEKKNIISSKKSSYLLYLRGLFLILSIAFFFIGIFLKK